MGALNKLLIEVDGEPMVRRVAAAALASKAAPVVVVTGHEAERVQEALAGLDVAVAHNPDFAEGMSTSLERGLQALDALLDPGIDPWDRRCRGLPRRHAAHERRADRPAH